LNQTGYGGNTSLYLATAQKDIENVKVLLKANADPDIQNIYDDWASLHNAVNNGYLDIVLELIKAIAKLNLRDNYGKCHCIWQQSMGI
jgi:ankyrin repeat protein